jgi:hypothetical protein
VKTIVKEGGTEIQDPEIIPPSRRGRWYIFCRFKLLYIKTSLGIK